MKQAMADFREGMKDLSRYNPEEFRKFNEFVASVLKDGKLDLKTKELIALGIAIAVRCTYCIGIHVEKCFKAGATADEIMEAATVAVLMGGGPALTYVAEVKKAVDLFNQSGQTT